MELEELHEMILLLSAANAFEIEDLAEVVIVSVRDVDEVCLYQGLGGRWPDLECFEESLDLEEAAVDALYEASWSRGRE